MGVFFLFVWVFGGLVFVLFLVCLFVCLFVCFGVIGCVF